MLSRSASRCKTNGAGRQAAQVARLRQRVGELQRDGARLLSEKLKLAAEKAAADRRIEQLQADVARLTAELNVKRLRFPKVRPSRIRVDRVASGARRMARRDTATLPHRRKSTNSTKPRCPSGVLIAREGSNRKRFDINFRSKFRCDRSIDSSRFILVAVSSAERESKVRIVCRLPMRSERRLRS